MHDEKTNCETAREPERIGSYFLTGSGILLKILTPAVLGLTLFVSGCESVSSTTSQDLEKTKESQTMEIAQTNIVHTPAIPPIDAVSPKKTETATFALG